MAACFCLGLAGGQEAPPEKPQKGPLYRVSAKELAKEFRDDAVSAHRKYGPGARVEVTGALESEKKARGGSELYLATGENTKVLVRAREVTGKRSDLPFVRARGRFVRYSRPAGLILIEASKAELRPTAEDKK
jgi:hypothetical protein